MEILSIITLVIGGLGLLLHVKKFKSKCCEHECFKCIMDTDNERSQRQETN